MTIVDRQHAAEAVTSKGKVFKFDAIECMVCLLYTSDAADERSSVDLGGRRIIKKKKKKRKYRGRRTTANNTLS